MPNDVFTCTDHEGRWVGVASVIVASTEDEARSLLSAELKVRGLDGVKSFTLVRVDTSIPKVLVLQDGDY